MRKEVVITETTDAKKAADQVLNAPLLKIQSPVLSLEDPNALMCLQGEYGVHHLTAESKFTKMGTKYANTCISILITNNTGDYFFAHYAERNFKDNILTEISKFKNKKSFSVILIGGSPIKISEKAKFPIKHVINIINCLVDCAKSLKATFTVVGQRLFKNYLIDSGESKYFFIFGKILRDVDMLQRYIPITLQDAKF